MKVTLTDQDVTLYSGTLFPHPHGVARGVTMWLGNADAELPVTLDQFYASGTILIHHSTDGAIPAGGPATAFDNLGGGGALFDATVTGTALPISGTWMQASGSVGYPQIATAADLVGVRLMWVMQPDSSTGTYRFFGRSDTFASYVRINNGDTLQMWSNRTGSATSVVVAALPASSDARLFELEITGTTAELFVNGVSAGSNTIPWAAFEVDRLTQGNSGMQAFAGNMGDILGVVTGQADTASAIAAAREYLNDRFALGLTL